MTAEEIAQWVIDNRYPKSEFDKVSDFEMYHFVKEAIEKNVNTTHIANLEKENQGLRDGYKKLKNALLKMTSAHLSGKVLFPEMIERAKQLLSNVKTPNNEK